jgi:hypothetical protein
MPKPTAAPPAAAAARPSTTAAGDRRLRLSDILKLLVNDGWVDAETADRLARSPTRAGDGPLELVANQKWRAAAPPPTLLTRSSAFRTCMSIR